MGKQRNKTIFSMNLLLSAIFLFLLLINLSYHIVNGDENNKNNDDDETMIISDDDSDSGNVNYETPTLEPNKYYLYEPFDDVDKFHSRWHKSNAHKSDSNDLKYDGEWDIVRSQDRLKDDLALITKSKARHHAYSTKLDKIFKFNSNENHPFILQYEAQFRNGQECGGAYLKLLSSSSGDLKNLNDKTKYSIMFGPDKCGNENKLHFIFNHKNPRNGSITEKHWIKSSSVTNFDDIFKDNRWHQFRLEIYPDNTFQVSVDKNYAQKGSLLEDFKPPVNPPKTIDDPNDSKPEDWDEREKIPDPDAVKPDDWDENEPRKIPDPNAVMPDNWDENEPEMIHDPNAVKPDDWDQEMDGDWEAPLIPNPKCASLAGCGKWSAPLIDNPKYKGKWKAPMIANPAYKGKWVPRKIPNPDFYEDLNPFKTLAAIDALAFELWTISDNIAFDNLLITDDLDVANYVSSLTYQIKKDLSDEETDNIVVKLMKYANKNPWMWAVYLFVIGIPLVLFIAFCCVSPVSKKSSSSEQQTEQQQQQQQPQEKYDPSISKKTDEPRPDVIPPEEKKTTPKSINKIDEEEEEEIEAEEDEEEEEEAEEDGNENEPDEEEEQEQEAEKEEKVMKQSSPHSSPRQRRPRKE